MAPTDQKPSGHTVPVAKGKQASFITFEKKIVRTSVFENVPIIYEIDYNI